MANTIHSWAKIALPDPSTYYGGYKEPRLLTIGPIQRALSDRRGNFETASFDFTISDHDRLIRGKLAGLTSKWLTNKTVIARMISDEDRRALLVPRIVGIGKIRDFQPFSPLQFKFTCEDYLATYMGIGNKDNQIPKRVVTLEDFPAAPEDKGESGAAATVGKTYTTPHPSITIPPCPDYVQLSDEAAIKIFVTSNGTYGLCDARGWIMYDGSGTFISEGWGGHNPPVPGDVVFASPDVAAACEGSSGGSTSLVTVGLPVPIIYGNMSDQGIDGGPGRGQCAAVYAGIYTLADGNQYHKFIVAGHAVKAITGIYTEGGTTGVGTSPATSVGDLAATTAAGTGGPWIVPGYDAWEDMFGPGAALFEDINGRRYTVVYGKVGTRTADVGAGYYDATDRDATPLAFNVEGVEDIGDGTGTLITDGFAIYKHFLRNFLLGDYASGNWPTTGPVWPETTVEVLDDASFDAASVVCGTRIDGGYTGAVIIGGGDEQASVRDWIQRFNQSLDCFVGMSRNFQFMCRVMDLSLGNLALARPYNQVNSMFGDSFNVKLEPIENVVTYSYSRDFALSSWRKDAIEFEDAESVAAIEERKPGQLIEMWLTRDQVQADDVAQRRLLWAKEPPKVVSFKADLNLGLVTELGDLAAVTHLEGLSSTGWTNYPVWISRHELNPDDMSVTMQGYDVDRIFSGSAILGNEAVLAATWTTAGVSDQAYLYLCDEVTGTFSDGRPGRRLR